MDEKDKRNNIISLVLRLLSVLAGAALCVPVAFFFNDLISGGSTTVQTMCGAAICTCLVALVVLAVVAGIRALAGKPFRLTVAVIALTAAVCLAAAFVFVRRGPEPSETSAEASPRPTVTPPVVEIADEETENSNPESGTVFYKKYADNSVRLTVDNASSQDIYVRLRTKDKMTVLSFYIRANDTVTVNGPTGTYEYVCALGKEWEDRETYFGENTRFKKSKEFCVYRFNDEKEIRISKSMSELLEVSRREFEK